MEKKIIKIILIRYTIRKISHKCGNVQKCKKRIKIIRERIKKNQDFSHSHTGYKSVKHATTPEGVDSAPCDTINLYKSCIITTRWWVSNSEKMFFFISDSETKNSSNIRMCCLLNGKWLSSSWPLNRFPLKEFKNCDKFLV